MSLRMKLMLALALSSAEASFGQEPMAIDAPVTVAQPLAVEQPMVGSPAFGEMIFEEPADWWPMESASDYWVTGEYWFGWMKGVRLPPLVTTSPAGTPYASAGKLESSTVLLSGRANDDVRPGFRFQTGYWLDREFGVRLEAGVSFLSSQSSQYDFDSTDFPILGRPFTEADNLIPTSEAIVVAHPDAALGSTGSISIKAKSGTYQDANFDFAESIYRSDDTNIDALFGYRFGRFSDRIRSFQRINPNAIPNSHIDSEDEFNALNIFHGMEFGFRGELERGDLTLTLLGKMAAGNLTRKVHIKGRTTSVSGNGTSTSSGGVYALLPNLGDHKDTEFTVFPEYGAILNWRVRQNLRVHVGYRAMILFDAVRAADQIDFTLNSDFIPPVANPNSTPRRPINFFHDDNFWIQSLTIGGEWSF